MDLGDKNHQICVIDSDGNEVESVSITNTAQSVRKYFGKHADALVAIEAGTHSGWISRILEGMGCEVLVGNPRKLKAIWASQNKSDVRDAEMLARIARVDRKLLHPIHHRGEAAQVDLEIIKARDMLVRARSQLVNHVRGSVKAIGGRVKLCSTSSFGSRAKEEVPEILQAAMALVLETIEELTVKIKAYDKQIDNVANTKYPETDRLRQIKGVGPVTALAYVLTIEESSRFKKGRQVGAFLGLTPRRDQSGGTDKQLRITKAGNCYLRRLLVGCSHYIMGPFGPDCDLRRYGQRIAQRGGKNTKRRAVVAVARKLSVLMYKLWTSESAYEPIRCKAA
jgi:transposase